MMHLIMVMEAPLMSFGGESVDQYSNTWRLPGASMLTGLLGNALGYNRTDAEQLQRLQDRLVFAARADREPGPPAIITDYQTVLLNEADSAWTTFGPPEGRSKSPLYVHDRRDGQKKMTWQRFIQYLPDAVVTVAARLDRAEEAPDIHDLARALEEPDRPLFIGKKHCLPVRQIMDGFSEGASALEALLNTPLGEGGAGNGAEIRTLWSDEEPGGSQQEELARTARIPDLRNWRSGFHGGDRNVREAMLPREMFRQNAEAPEED